MSIAEQIIERFGGVRPMAAKLGIAPTTVQGWKASGFIPARRQPAVMSAARQYGIELAATDFIPEPERAA